MIITADTNIFVYLHDADELEKRYIARRVVSRLLDLEVSISLQVVGEFYSALARKLRVPSWIAARESRNLLESFDTFAPSRDACERALEQAATGRNSYWDALLLATSAEAKCSILLSEDMADGEFALGVKIINPFGSGAIAPEALRALGLA